MMKIRLSILLAILILTTAITAQQAPSADVALKAAVHREFVEGDLQAAIRDYNAIITRFPSDRVVRAKALVQLGGCYEKLGQADARKAYEQVIRDYADQGDAAAHARARLAALAGTAGAVGSSTLAVRRVSKGVAHKVSADGRFISFTDMSWNLAIHDLATGRDRRLTEEGSLNGPEECGEYSAPSPDGKSVAYAWRRRGGFESARRRPRRFETAGPRSLRKWSRHPDSAGMVA